MAKTFVPNPPNGKKPMRATPNQGKATPSKGKVASTGGLAALLGLKAAFLTFDHGLGALGLVTATASASFAFYMVTSDRSHPTFNGIEHLALFSKPNRPTTEPAAPASKPEDTRIDYSAVGAIPEARNPPGWSNSKLAPKATDAAGTKTTLALDGFALREVKEGTALIQTKEGLFTVTIGSPLPDGGVVKSIEWHSGKWVVVTTKGLIEESRY
jgi:hypothetical protein